jgi:hypothetical protein
MKYSILFAASLAVIGLAACEKPTVVNTPAPVVAAPPPTVQVVPVPVPVPGPQGTPGAPGADGMKGEPGKGGDTVVVVPPSTK